MLIVVGFFLKRDFGEEIKSGRLQIIEAIAFSSFLKFLLVFGEGNSVLPALF